MKSKNGYKLWKCSPWNYWIGRYLKRYRIKRMARRPGKGTEIKNI
jgi:hypothetical protein